MDDTGAQNPQPTVEEVRALLAEGEQLAGKLAGRIKAMQRSYTEADELRVEIERLKCTVSSMGDQMQRLREERDYYREIALAGGSEERRG